MTDTPTTALLIGAILLLLYLGAWVREIIRCRRYKKKQRASVTVDYTARVREQGKELRRVTRGRK
jgi:hypothetical protein